MHDGQREQLYDQFLKTFTRAHNLNPKWLLLFAFKLVLLASFKVKILLNFEVRNEGRRANFNTSKRILKW